MLELNVIRREPEKVKAGLRKRNWKEEDLGIVDRILALDEQRRKLQTQRDELLAQSNKLSKQIGQLFKQGKREAVEALKAQVTTIKATLKELQERKAALDTQLEALLLSLPNIPHPSVPAGSSDADNEIYKDWSGALPQLPATAQPHWELAKQYGIFDLELGAKLTGAGFPVFRGQGARLERALINFFLDEARAAGYEEIQPPLLVNADTARGTGQLPDKEGQMYYIEKDELYLIPTAEVPITNIFRDAIVPASALPIKMAGYTPCFRREAGSYGAHVRGLNRVHQFDKVEIVQIAHPQHSYEVLEEMLAYVSSLLDKLELLYRIVKLCGGDLGFTAALTYDFEVWSAAQERWLEVSSVSNFETYQANRMKLRFRDGQKKTQLAHTLNGSALALARVVAALLEQNQEPDGIRIPQVLVPYTGFERIVRS